MIPDLSACTLVHHCLSPELLACGLFFAVGMACRDLAFSPVSDLPPPHRAMTLMLTCYQHPASDNRECILVLTGLSTCHVHEHRLMGRPRAGLWAVVLWDREAWIRQFCPELTYLRTAHSMRQNLPEVRCPGGIVSYRSPLQRDSL